MLVPTKFLVDSRVDIAVVSGVVFFSVLRVDQEVGEWQMIQRE